MKDRQSNPNPQESPGTEKMRDQRGQENPAKGDFEQEEPVRREYSFMQEVIKDEAIGGQKWKNRILRIIGYGVVFGVAASIVFCALNPWIEDMFKNSPEQVEIDLEEESTEDSDKTGKTDGLSQETASGGEADLSGEEKEKKEPLDEDDYREVVQSLTSTATKSKQSIAVLSVVEPSGGQVVSARAGVVLADNGRELLVLAKAVEEKDGGNLQVTFSDGKPYKAAIKMCDYNLGLGVYAVERSEIEEASWAGIDEIRIGNSNLLEAGDIILAMGTPFGSDNAVGIGTFAPDDASIELADGQYHLLCTNIACEEGGSGILMNQNGLLVGMIVQDALPEGSKGRIGGYGISDIKKVIELMSNGVTVPYTGVYGMDVTEELEEKGMPKGVYVKEVSANSPAMAAGIQSGDVIYKVSGTDIASIKEYHDILMKTKEGQGIKLNGYRQGAGEEYVGIEFNVVIGRKQQD